MRDPRDELRDAARGALRAVRRSLVGFARFGNAHLGAGMFLATSLPAGLFWSLVAIFLAATGTALAAALVGIPILLLVVLSIRLAAGSERRRVGRMLGVRIPPPERALRLARPRELAYVLLLPALGATELAVVVFAFALPLPLATYPLWTGAMDGGALVLVPSVALGVGAACLGIPLVRRAAAVHVRLARSLLGPPDGRLGLGPAAAASGSAALTATAAAVCLGVAVVLAAQASQLDLAALWAVVTSPREVEAFFEGFGAWAPVAFLAVQAAQVVVSVVPAGPLTLAGVAAFGPWLGFVLSLAGACAGSFVAFFLGRRFGRPMVTRLVGERTLERRAGRMDPRGRWVLVALLLPLPAGGDAVCALAGLSGVPLGRFALLVIAGRAPYTALAVLLASGAMGRSAGALVACLFMAVLAAAGALAYPTFRTRSRAIADRREEPPDR